MNIRPALPSDRDAVWTIFQAVIAPGDAFVFAPSTPRDTALAWWFGPGTHSYVAEQGGEIVGSYVFKPNQPGLGSHVANAAYMVSPEARGLGLGRKMGEHSLVEAKLVGFQAMQFNAVVSSNTAAVNLWQQLGFHIVGTIPGAFRHAQLGYVDTHIMFRSL